MIIFYIAHNLLLLCEKIKNNQIIFCYLFIIFQRLHVLSQTIILSSVVPLLAKMVAIVAMDPAAAHPLAPFPPAEMAVMDPATTHPLAPFPPA
jgi:hypothetical protein